MTYPQCPCRVTYPQCTELTYPESSVNIGGTSVRDSQHKQWHVVELLASADGETKAS